MPIHGYILPNASVIGRDTLNFAQDDLAGNTALLHSTEAALTGYENITSLTTLAQFREALELSWDAARTEMLTVFTQDQVSYDALDANEQAIANTYKLWPVPTTEELATEIAAQPEPEPSQEALLARLAIAERPTHPKVFQYPSTRTASNAWLRYGLTWLSASRGFEIDQRCQLFAIDIHWDARYQTSGSIYLLQDGRKLIRAWTFPTGNKASWAIADLIVEPGTYQFRMGALKGHKKIAYATCTTHWRAV